eukprot:scaffold321207_cov30-Tisochrysis_lutea.AAC.1
MEPRAEHRARIAALLSRPDPRILVHLDCHQLQQQQLEPWPYLLVSENSDHASHAHELAVATGRPCLAGQSGPRGLHGRAPAVKRRTALACGLESRLCPQMACHSCHLCCQGVHRQQPEVPRTHRNRGR